MYDKCHVTLSAWNDFEQGIWNRGVKGQSSLMVLFLSLAASGVYKIPKLRPTQSHSLCLAVFHEAFWQVYEHIWSWKREAACLNMLLVYLWQSLCIPYIESTDPLIEIFRDTLYRRVYTVSTARSLLKAILYSGHLFKSNKNLRSWLNLHCMSHFTALRNVNTSPYFFRYIYDSTSPM